ncbi:MULTISPECIES: hypothetical protein [Bacillus]|uniref:hypothetical protein n=1 Tax=Bacillus TaxID=1386 RepID=UPI0012DB2449|nr:MULTISPECIES: hypothetical protein [Bacillus]MBD0398376.1 hypothetical protein [Bacillus sp. 2211]MBZ5518949.1 hypothetical protein [Bacillus sp. KS1]MDF3255392.1 hypothetical protein [Bacillus velezensis]MDF3267379.1 hypothetical protein [Bacillus velezensis]MEC1339061.1 hypothetical protein [Bacillus velezensis]
MGSHKRKDNKLISFSLTPIRSAYAVVKPNIFVKIMSWAKMDKNEIFSKDICPAAFTIPLNVTGIFAVVFISRIMKDRQRLARPRLRPILIH